MENENLNVNDGAVLLEQSTNVFWGTSPRHILGKQSCIRELFGLCLQHWAFIKSLFLGSRGELENEVAQPFGPSYGR